MKSKQLTPNISTVIVMALFLAAFTVPMNIQAAVYEGIEDPNLKEADSTVEPSITTEALSVPSIGGPDFGGYYYLDNQEPDGPAFDWIEISGTGTNLNLADDSYSSAINLPFSFDFYGTNFTQVTVGSNGGVYFQNSYLTASNQCLPGDFTIDTFIALYWDDLAPGGSNGGVVYYEIIGSAPNRKLVVQWQDVDHYGSSTKRITAQVQLHENSEILLLYADPSSEAGSRGTVGIQYDSSTGLQYICSDAELTAGLAVLFIRDYCPEPQVPASPQPNDGAVDIPIDTMLGWNGASITSAPSQPITLAPSQFIQTLMTERTVYEGVEDLDLKEQDCAARDSATAADDIHVAGSEGPDPGGYYYFDNQEPGGPAFDWIEISGTGTNLNLYDDTFSSPITLPFNFNFYDANYSQVTVGSNGGVYFVNQYLTLGNSCIPSAISGIDQLIALYWTDLCPGCYSNSIVYYDIVGTAPNRRLVVQFQDVVYCCSNANGVVTAQAQLHENGDILLLYVDPSSLAGSDATVGIQNDAATGLQYSCNEPSISEGLAVLFTRDPLGHNDIYDVYFGTDPSQMQQIGTDLSTPVCTPPSILDYETTYYWQVSVRNDCSDLIKGPIWSFTTEGCPEPEVPSNPQPADEADNVPINTLLTWDGNCDDTCGVENGGFETGQLDPWTVVTEPVGSQPWFAWEGIPSEGLWSAYSSFETVEAEASYDLYQEVEIPSCAPAAILTWSEFLYWDEAGGTLPREYTVSIQPAGGGEPLAILYSEQIQPGTYNYDIIYVNHSVDLLELDPSIAGQTVRINFHQYMPEPNVGFAVVILDGISLTCGDNPISYEDPVNYDVYLGTDMSQMELVATDLEEPVFNPCILDYEATYYWQVIASNACTQIPSPIWSFTTEPWQSLPDNGAVDVPIDTALEWNAPIDDGGDDGGGDCDEPCGVENGGFETGEFTDWTTVTGSGSEFQPWTLATAGSGNWFANGIPFEGTYFAQNGFDGDAGLYYDLYQETAIPACAPSAILTWSDRIQWDMYSFGGSTLPREYVVSVQPAGGGTPLANVYSMQLDPGTLGDTGYVTHSVDLLELAPSIAGQTVRINFHQYIPETMTGPAQFDLDGISLVCGGQVQASSVTPAQSEASTVDFEALTANYEQTRQQALDAAQRIRDEYPWPLIETQTVSPETSNGGVALAPSDGQILNGDFETGTLDSWTLLNASENGSFVINDGTLIPASPDDALPPYNGNYSAISDVHGPGIFTIYQDVILPADATTLTLHWVDMLRNHHDSFSDPDQEFSVQIWDLENQVLTTLFSTDPGDTLMTGWTERSADLMPFVGQTVRIAFTGNIQLYYFNVHLDDIRIETDGTPPDDPIYDGPFTFDVYLGTDPSQMELVGVNLAEPVFNPCILDYETTYFWQVIIKTDCGQAASPICNFTTEAWQPLPEDGAMDVPIDTILNWNGPISGGGNCDETCGVENGGFETGEFAPWTAVTGLGVQLTEWNIGSEEGGFFENGFPFEGSSYAQNGFDGEAGLYYDLYQETAIPDCAPSAILTWSERIQWSIDEEAVLPREYIVSVQPAGGGAPLAIVYSMQLDPGTLGDTGYVTHSVDLLELAPSIAGQTVRINFHQSIPESLTGPAQFDLDGISLVCDGQVQPSSVTSVQLEASAVDFEALRAEYNSIRESAANQALEAPPESIDPTLGGSDYTPSRNLVNALTTTDTQQVIDAFDRGWWTNDGSHGASNKNTFTGQNGSGTQLFNSFFVFDLTSVPSGSFASATLRLEIENHYGPDDSESLTIYDVSTSISELTSSGTNLDVYNDLESGNSYGNFTVVPADVGSILEITLNSQALADIGAAAGGYFAVGLHLDNITLASGDEGVRFSETDEARVHQLVLTTSSGGGGNSSITYDVYLSTDASQMELAATDLEEPVFNPCILDYETTYYWQVIVKADCGEIASPICSFTTQAWQPLPENGAMEVPIDTILNWNGPFDEQQQALDAALSNDNICSPPEGMAYMMGMLIEIADADEVSSPTPDAAPQSQPIPGATLINFDNAAAPCMFMETVRLTNEYAALGVTFEGPGGNDGGAVVNECGNWSVSGHSSPNFLGFNFSVNATLADGGRPISPEIIHFNPPVSHIEVLAGVGSTSGAVTLEAYNHNDDMVDTSTITLSPTMSPISVSGNAITRVVISSTSDAFVLDDLQFVPEEEGPPTTPISYDVYFGLVPNNLDLIGEGLDVPECDPTPELDEVLRKGRVYYWQVVANNTCGEVVSPLWSFTTENTPPVANAGPDQLVFCWIDGMVCVSLDGAGSYDEDGNPITYHWSWTIDDQTFSASGVSPEICLPASVHTITLVVNDGIDDSEPEEIVVDAQPPVEISVNCTPKSLNCESNGNWITAHFTLPAEYSNADIDTSAVCTLEPMGLQTHQLHISNNEEGQGVLSMTFDRVAFCELDPPNGHLQLTPTGRLTNGQYFYASDTIRILDNRMEHFLNLADNWLQGDCEKPHWCNGLDINADGAVDLRDFSLIDELLID